MSDSNESRAGTAVESAPAAARAGDGVGPVVPSPPRENVTLPGAPVARTTTGHAPTARERVPVRVPGHPCVAVAVLRRVGVRAAAMCGAPTRPADDPDTVADNTLGAPRRRRRLTLADA